MVPIVCVCVCLPWPPWHVEACQIRSQLGSSAVILVLTRDGHSSFLEAANGTVGQAQTPASHETPSPLRTSDFGGERRWRAGTAAPQECYRHPHQHRAEMAPFSNVPSEGSGEGETFDVTDAD